MSTTAIDRRSLLALLAGSSAAFWTLSTSAAESNSAGESDRDDAAFPGEGNAQLQAIGALGVGHIQSTLGLIGVIADSLSKEIYLHKQVEDLMTGTINSLEAPKRILRRLQDTNISGDDAEFLDRMISVLNALQREAKALVVYSKSRKPEEAAIFEKSRKLSIRKLGELTQQEVFLDSGSASPRVPTSKPNRSDDGLN